MVVAMGYKERNEEILSQRAQVSTEEYRALEIQCTRVMTKVSNTVLYSLRAHRMSEPCIKSSHNTTHTHKSSSITAILNVVQSPSLFFGVAKGLYTFRTMTKAILLFISHGPQITSLRSPLLFSARSHSYNGGSSVRHYQWEVHFCS